MKNFPEKNKKQKRKHRMLWGFIYTIVFIISFVASAVFKMIYQPSWTKDYTVDWNDSIGKKYLDISYGEKTANKFDLYIPADNTKKVMV